MNKYKNLIFNTLIFGIGTFSSKILVFLLMPLYTRILTNSEYGVVDLIVQISNLLIPIVSVSTVNSIIRFGLDKSVKKSDVFTTGLVTIICGFIVFLFFRPMLLKVQFVSEYTSLIYMYVLMSCLRSLCSQFVRAKKQVKLYALDGVLSTITVIVFNVLFLVVFKMGIVGYVLAIVVSDALSTMFLFWIANLKRYVDLRGFNKNVTKSMLKYSIPLIPTTIFWWITNVSNRYIVADMIGSDANGLFAVAYKIPTIIILVSGIFMDAWQMSAITEKDSKNNVEFFTKVFGSFQSIVFLAASGLILCTKLITKMLVSDAFYASWQYVPFLIMATTFSCFVTFLGSVYVVEKKSMLALTTTAVGAVLNVALNILFIPKYGVNGAAFATFVSFFIIFAIRAVNTKKFVDFNLNMPKIILNLCILLVQSILLIEEIKYWIVYEVLLVILVGVINMKPIMLSIRKILSRR